MNQIKIASDASVSALLGALAGFLLSESKLAFVAVPLDALKAICFIAAFVTLFTAPNFLFDAMAARRKGQRQVTLLLLTSYALAFIFVASNVIAFGSESGRQINLIFTNNYALPLLITPMFWAAMLGFEKFVLRSNP